MPLGRPEFQFDVLIDRHNLCDRRNEIRLLNRLVAQKRRIILYGPRRYGKTSLIRNAVGEDFHKRFKGGLVVQANFMGVTKVGSIAQRMNAALSSAMSRQFPLKTLLKSATEYLRNISFQVSVDPLSGLPSVEIKGGIGKPQQELEAVFASIRRVSHSLPVFLILDEFQDVHQVPEATALLRGWLQELNDTPVAILGSKRRLLSDMFARSTSPLFNYGEEVVLGPIPVAEWLPYFNARLSASRLSIKEEALSTMTGFLCDVPNAICEVGAWLVDREHRGSITTERLFQSLDRMLSEKEESLRFQLAALSEKELSIVKAIARTKYVTQVNAKEFLKQVDSSPNAVNKTVQKLALTGFLEHEPELGYRLSDPILRAFLVRIERS